MNQPAYNDRCEQAAANLVRQAAWPSISVMLVIAALPLWLPSLPSTSPASILMSLAAAAGFATLALSALLIFDALLFRLMAGAEDELAGGKTVDDLLEKMRLKTPPASTRSLDDRLAGTRRLLQSQRLAFAIFASGTLATLILIGSNAA